MAEGSDSGEGAEGDADVVDGETEEAVDDKDASLDGIVEKANDENLTPEQIKEVKTLMAKANINVEDLPNWLRGVIYSGKNIWNFISKKWYVDRKVEEYLNQDLRAKDVYVALHGTLQTYWSSFADFVNYCEEKGIVVIPIESSSAEQIYKSIEDIKQKTGARIHVLAHSRGARYALDAVVDHGLDKLVKEIIISGAPIHKEDGSLARREYSRVGSRVKLTNIYGVTDQILPLFGSANYGGLENATNIAVDMGHLDLLHNPDIFERYINPKLNYQLSIPYTSSTPLLNALCPKAG